MSMIREKRDFTRITIDMPGSISLYQLQAYHSGPISDISPSGCFFPLEGNLPQGEPCNITITVGEGLESEEIVLAGIITRSDSRGTGIRFTDDSPTCRSKLKRIIFQDQAEK